MPDDGPPLHATTPLVAVAGSAGGFQALAELLASIPPGFAAPILVALHRSGDFPNLLVDLLRRGTTLAVEPAREGQPLEAGTVHVCPPGAHMTADRVLRLFEMPKLNYVRPSADLMFVSVARAYGRRAIGVVLSGAGTDAAIGGKAIVDAGGTLIAQDPGSAEQPGMPSAAAALGPARHVLTPRDMGPALQRELDRLALDREDPAAAPAPAAAGGAADPAATRVLLADDHRIVLDGLRALLNGERDLTVLPRAAEDGRAAVRLSAELNPDVVVMDLAMPGLDGVAATRQILAQNPAARVIALTAHTDARTTQRALRAGASAVLSKQKAYDELPAAIRSVMAGRVYVSRRGHAAETSQDVTLR